jgi:hypothetical protein
MTKENVFGSGACTLFSHRVTYSLHDGGSHGMNLAMAGVVHPYFDMELLEVGTGKQTAQACSFFNE